MTEVKNLVLIHPDYRTLENKGLFDIWADLITQGAAYIPSSPECYHLLYSPTYADQLPVGSQIRLGGQEGGACVLIHALELAKQSELVQHGTVSVVVDSELTCGYQNWTQDVEEIFATVQRQMGVTIKLV